MEEGTVFQVAPQSTDFLYQQFGNWQLMCYHLDRYWGILPSRSNGWCNWGDKSYSRWEETTELPVLNS